MLDVPNFFWDSEPTLHPLYFAVRGKLEFVPILDSYPEISDSSLDRIPRNQASNSSAERKVSSIPRPRRDSDGLDCQ